MTRAFVHRRLRARRGFAMLLVFVMAASVAILLYLEMPRLVLQAQREKEDLLIERGEQYRRAIQIYVRKNKRYPQEIGDLEKSGEQRYLRRRFKDPFTNKDDWRLIHVDAAGAYTDSLIHKPPDPMGKEKKLETQFASAGTAPGAFGAAGMPAAGAFPGQPGVPGQPGAPVDPSEVPNALMRRASDRPAIAVGQPGYDPNNPPDPNQPQENEQPGNPPESDPTQPADDPNQTPPPGNYPPVPNFAPGVPQLPQPGSYPPVPTYVPGSEPGAQTGLPPGSPSPFPNAPGSPFPGAAPGQPGTVPYLPPGMPQPPGYPAVPGGVPNAPLAGGYPGGYVPPGYPAGGVVAPGMVPQGVPGMQPGQYPQVAPWGGSPFSPPAGFPSPGRAVSSQTGGTIRIPIGGPPGGAPGNAAIDMIRQILTTPRPGGMPGAAAGTGGMGAGIAGVASKADGVGVKVYNERTKFKEWEFLFDLRQEKAPGGGQGAVGSQPAGSNPAGSMPGSSPFGTGSAPASPQRTSPFGQPGAQPRR